MTTIETILGRLAAGLNALRSAGAASFALETGRRPAEADLRALGIDPRAFASIGHG